MCFIHLGREHEDRLTFDQTWVFFNAATLQPVGHCLPLQQQIKKKNKKKKAASAGAVTCNAYRHWQQRWRVAYDSVVVLPGLNSTR